MKPYALLVVASVAAVGCARSAEERQLDAMRHDIDDVRDSRDRADRDGFVVPPAYTAAAPAAPAPKIVQLGPAAEDAEVGGDAADPQDTTPRPVIRVLGQARAGGRRGWRGDDVVEQSSPDDVGSARGAGAFDPDAKRAYDSAMSLVDAKRYDEALDALARFLVKWPDHPYASAAMYWRGECYFARGDYAHAVEQFEGVLARFPGAPTVPDVLLKLGLAHQQLGHAAKAKAAFDRLAQQYGDSDAARRIPSRARPATPDPGGSSASIPSRPPAAPAQERP